MSYKNNLHSKCDIGYRPYFVASHIKNGLASDEVDVSAEELFDCLGAFKLRPFNKLHPPIQGLTACRVFSLELINEVFTEQLHISKYSKMT
jgi:hypothetical protein